MIVIHQAAFFSFIKDLFGDPVSQQTLKRPDVENEARPRKDVERF